MTDTLLNERAVIGGNEPPEPTPREAFATHLNDLQDEAKNWLDGAEIETQAQADALSRLMDDIRKSAKGADEQRKIEAKPWDDGKKEVQDYWNPLLKRADTAVTTAKSVLAKWLIKVDAEQRRIAEEKRIAADAESKAAVEALREAAGSDNLAAKEAAEEQVAAAAKSQASATKAEKARPQAAGSGRAVGLRTVWSPAIADFYVALEHYSTNQPEAFEALIIDLARKDVAMGKRQIAGITVTEEKVAQ